VTKSAKTRKTSRRTSTSRTSTAGKRGAAPKRKGKDRAASAPPTSPAADPAAAKDKAAYLESVIATGEAAPLDKHGKLPAGATHKIVQDEAGNVTVVRRRFSIS